MTVLSSNTNPISTNTTSSHLITTLRESPTTVTASTTALVHTSRTTLHTLLTTNLSNLLNPSTRPSTETTQRGGTSITGSLLAACSVCF